ncbi:MAG: YifB family Mg chelatase-like AAA ATPase [Alicyclobacillus sp.]|nr:YifB family Mg chelatase-like AAA ATPase [Alicyclobacillus sp.]
MLGIAYGAVLDGVEASVVRVEADVTQGLPQFHIVGLPDSAVQESKQRIRAALRNCGLPFPNCRITVNLAPASLKKRGPGLDLPIAIAILRAIGHLDPSHDDRVAYCAEISLAGDLLPVSGIINRALALVKDGHSEIVVAKDQLRDLVDIPDSNWYACHQLQEVARLTESTWGEHRVSAQMPPHMRPQGIPTFRDVHGMDAVKRAIAIAVTGHHSILLVGPPGAGKTMVAERIASVLPELNFPEALEVFAMHQACGVPRDYTNQPPVRSPHHSITRAGLIGGGNPPVPGEVTLANHGVLLLDELLEFSPDVLDSLREPLTTGQVRLTRAGHHTVFPAKFLLVGTMNPCKCGQYGFGDCTCRPAEIHRYWSSLSGPLLDRIDMVVPVRPEPVPAAWHGDDADHATHDLRILAQFGRVYRMMIQDPEVRALMPFTPQARRTLERASLQLGLSARARSATVRVARSIAWLDVRRRDKIVTAEHVQEALSYRLTTRP